MGSNGKKKTTMAKLTRESKLRERRLDKQAKKDARKRAAAEPAPVATLAGDAFDGEESPPVDVDVDVEVEQAAPVDGVDEESRERGSNP